MTELECPFQLHGLHNAGNDATYTLHAMLMLAIRSPKVRELTAAEMENLYGLQMIAQAELSESKTWPICVAQIVSL